MSILMEAMNRISINKNMPLATPEMWRELEERIEEEIHRKASFYLNVSPAIQINWEELEEIRA